MSPPPPSPSRPTISPAGKSPRTKPPTKPASKKRKVNTSLPWRVEEAADDGLYSGMFSKFHVSKQTAPSTAKGGSPAEQDAGSGQSKFKSIVVTQSAFPALYRARDRAVFHRDADAVEELEGGVEIAEGEHKSFTEARADRGRKKRKRRGKKELVMETSSIPAPDARPGVSGDRDGEADEQTAQGLALSRPSTSASTSTSILASTSTPDPTSTTTSTRKRRAFARKPAPRIKLKDLGVVASSQPTLLRQNRRVKASVPFDIWLAILSYCPPGFLVRARSISRDFRAALTLDGPWKTSRFRTYGAGCPAPPLDLSEMQYADLLEGRGCQNGGCGDTEASKIYWSSARRWCEACFAKRVDRRGVIEGVCEAKYPEAGVLDAVTHCTIGDWGHYMYVGSYERSARPDWIAFLSGARGYDRVAVAAVMRQLDVLSLDTLLTSGAVEEDPEARTNWLATKKTEAATTLDSLQAVESFFFALRPEKNKQLEDVRQGRQALFAEMAAKLKPPLAVKALLKMDAYKNAAAINRPASLRCWASLLPKIMAQRERAEMLVAEQEALETELQIQMEPLDEEGVRAAIADLARGPSQSERRARVDALEAWMLRRTVREMPDGGEASVPKSLKAVARLAVRDVVARYEARPGVHAGQAIKDLKGRKWARRLADQDFAVLVLKKTKQIYDAQRRAPTYDYKQANMSQLCLYDAAMVIRDVIEPFLARRLRLIKGDGGRGGKATVDADTDMGEGAQMAESSRRRASSSHPSYNPGSSRMVPGIAGLLATIEGTGITVRDNAAAAAASTTSAIGTGPLHGPEPDSGASPALRFSLMLRCPGCAKRKASNVLRTFPQLVNHIVAKHATSTLGDFWPWRVPLATAAAFTSALNLPAYGAPGDRFWRQMGRDNPKERELRMFRIDWGANLPVMGSGVEWNGRWDLETEPGADGFEPRFVESAAELVDAYQGRTADACATGAGKETAAAAGQIDFVQQVLAVIELFERDGGVGLGAESASGFGTDRLDARIISSIAFRFALERFRAEARRALMPVEVKLEEIDPESAGEASRRMLPAAQRNGNGNGNGNSNSEDAGLDTIDSRFDSAANTSVTGAAGSGMTLTTVSTAAGQSQLSADQQSWTSTALSLTGNLARQSSWTSFNPSSQLEPATTALQSFSLLLSAASVGPPSMLGSAAVQSQPQSQAQASTTASTSSNARLPIIGPPTPSSTDQLEARRATAARAARLARAAPPTTSPFDPADLEPDFALAQSLQHQLILRGKHDYFHGFSCGWCAASRESSRRRFGSTGKKLGDLIHHYQAAGSAAAGGHAHRAAAGAAWLGAGAGAGAGNAVNLVLGAAVAAAGAGGAGRRGGAGNGAGNAGEGSHPIARWVDMMMVLCDGTEVTKALEGKNEARQVFDRLFRMAPEAEKEEIDMGLDVDVDVDLGADVDVDVVVDVKGPGQRRNEQHGFSGQSGQDGRERSPGAADVDEAQHGRQDQSEGQGRFSADVAGAEDEWVDEDEDEGEDEDGGDDENGDGDAVDDAGTHGQEVGLQGEDYGLVRETSRDGTGTVAGRGTARQRLPSIYDRPTWMINGADAILSSAEAWQE